MSNNGSAGTSEGTAGGGNGGDDMGPLLTSTGRMIQACDRCRWKKVKCDGLVPTCGRCTAAGLECRVTAKLSRKSYPKSYTESIEERVRELEAELAKSKETIEGQVTQMGELKRALTASPSSQTTPSSTGTRFSRRLGSGSDPSKSTQTTAKAGEPVVREVGRMNLDRTGTGRFMGSSSGIFFIGTAQHKFAGEKRKRGEKGGHVIGDELLRVESDDRSVPLVLHPASNVLSPLPAKATTLELIEVFYDTWGILLPVFHKPTFLHAVDELYSDTQNALLQGGRVLAYPGSSSGIDQMDWSTPPSPQPFLAHFYLVLALGLRHLEVGGSTTSPTCLDYFAEAMQIHDLVLSLNDLRTLQFQCLLTLWFSYIGKRSLALQTTGSMCKLALELGMHRHSRRFTYGPLLTEERKRCFWIIYLFDHFFSAVAGLPKSLRDEDVDADLPSDVDDEHVTQTEYLLALPGEPSSISKFICLIKLTQILSRVLVELYTTTNRRGGVGKIASAHRELEQWLHTLPSHLQIDAMSHMFAGGGGEREDVDPDVTFIHMVYWYARYITHRPAISFPSTDPQFTTSLRECVKAAKAGILLAHLAKDRLLAWDFNPGACSYTLWSNGVVVLFHIWDAPQNPLMEVENEGREAVQMCLDVLGHLVRLGRTGVVERVDDLRDMLAVTFDRSGSATFMPAATSVEVHMNTQPSPAQAQKSPPAAVIPTTTTAAGRGPVRSYIPPPATSFTYVDQSMNGGTNGGNGSMNGNMAWPSPMAFLDGINLNASEAIGSSVHEPAWNLWDDPVFGLVRVDSPGEERRKRLRLSGS